MGLQPLNKICRRYMLDWFGYVGIRSLDSQVFFAQFRLRTEAKGVSANIRKESNLNHFKNN